MESNNFISLSREDDKKLFFGIKMVPDKAMDRLTDSLSIYIEKCLNHWDKYYIIFKKKCSNDIRVNSYGLTKKGLRSYIDFLQNFYEDYDSVNNNISSNFNFGNIGTVSLKILHSNYLKITSRKSDDAIPSLNLFFVLGKKELLSYITKLKAIFSGKEIENYFESSFNKMSCITTQPLTKKEKDSLYINTLYLLADNSLDLKDKKAFSNISKEILKVTDDSFK